MNSSWQSLVIIQWLLINETPFTCKWLVCIVFLRRELRIKVSLLGRTKKNPNYFKEALAFDLANCFAKDQPSLFDSPPLPVTAWLQNCLCNKANAPDRFECPHF